jgi:hypothetical protein
LRSPLMSALKVIASGWIPSLNILPKTETEKSTWFKRQRQLINIFRE